MSITENDRKNLRELLQKRFSSLIFRRVHKVVLDENDRLPSRVYQNPDNWRLENVDETFTPEEEEKIVEKRYKKFYGFTTYYPLRENDNVKGAIYFNSNHYCEPDMIFNDFKLIRKPTNVPPRTSTPTSREDLLCMQVITERNGKNFANKWFICSEQFLRLWTSIMYDDHQSFESLCKKNHSEERIKTLLMTGNRLCTNSYLKFTNTYKQNNLEIDENEQKKRFFLLRTENMSKKWNHIYCAIVLIARYGELPTISNVPKNLDTFGNPQNPSLLYWSLPLSFVKNFIMNCIHKDFGDVDKCYEPQPQKIEDPAPLYLTPDDIKKTPELPPNFMVLKKPKIAKPEIVKTKPLPIPKPMLLSDLISLKGLIDTSNTPPPIRLPRIYEKPKIKNPFRNESESESEMDTESDSDSE